MGAVSRSGIRSDAYGSWMKSVTADDFRLNLSAYIGVAHHEPVMITSDRAEHQAVLISPEFYERALHALKAGTDSDSCPSDPAEQKPNPGDSIPINDLFGELGI